MEKSEYIYIYIERERERERDIFLCLVLRENPFLIVKT